MRNWRFSFFSSFSSSYFLDGSHFIRWRWSGWTCLTVNLNFVKILCTYVDVHRESSRRLGERTMKWRSTKFSTRLFQNLRAEITWSWYSSIPPNVWFSTLFGWMVIAIVLSNRGNLIILRNFLQKDCERYRVTSGPVICLVTHSLAVSKFSWQTIDELFIMTLIITR